MKMLSMGYDLGNRKGSWDLGDGQERDSSGREFSDVSPAKTTRSRLLQDVGQLANPADPKV